MRILILFLALIICPTVKGQDTIHDFLDPAKDGVMPQKKHPIAVSCYSKSLENSPKDVNVLYNRGISYLNTGDKEKACVEWKRVKELGSMDAEALIQEYCE